MTLIQEAIEALKTQYSNPFTDDDELIQRLYALDDEIEEHKRKRNGHNHHNQNQQA